MQELSINYPKTEVDIAKINKYTEKYKNEQADLVEQSIKEITFGELDVKNLSEQSIPMCKQYSLLFYRTKVFSIREPNAIMVKFFNQIFFGLITLMIF